MKDSKGIKGFIINREMLPKFFPTHRHSPQFWEHLGRTIATFGFLEEVLGKAIFAFTATHQYPSMEEAEKAYKAWLPKLEKALSDTLVPLADSYKIAALEHKNLPASDIEKLVCAIKEASEIRNVLCHGSWAVPNMDGKSVPLFVNKHQEIFDTAIDNDFLEQVQVHVSNLACSVIDTVECSGIRFPGSSLPGKVISQSNSKS